MTLPNPNAPVAVGSEEQVSRALTDPKATPLSDVYNIQELQKLELITTPKDVPLLTMLLSNPVRSGAVFFEWVETALSNDFTTGKYDGYDVSSISEAGGTPDRKGNWLMAYGQIARVGGLAQSLDTIDGNAMLLETKQKYIQLLRGIEYYLWRGDHTTNSDETNGVVELMTNSISNGSVALQEAILQVAIVEAVDNGIIPDYVFASPTVSYRIANYSEKRIRYDNTVEAQGGIGQKAFYYSTPFGYTVRVQPIRTIYIPSGTVYVMDSTMLTLRFSGDAVVTSKPLAEANDGTAVLMKAYFGLEYKNAESAVVITDVLESIT